MKVSKMLASVVAGVIGITGMISLQVQDVAAKEIGSSTDNQHILEESYGDLEYAFLDDGTIEITDCNNSVTSVDIPSEIDGIPVTSIGDFAFTSCLYLMKVTIPNSVTNIGFRAFCNCKSLKNINIPDSVTSIGQEALYETAWLKNRREENPLVIVNNLLIDGRTCTGDVEVPDDVISIIGGAFYGCEGLTGITIPDTVTNIGDEAFYECVSLTDINIPDSVKNIGYCAFCGCEALIDVIIPEDATIGEGAFSETPWLEEKREEGSLVIINNVLVDGTGCSGKVEVPQGVSIIEANAFFLCTGLTDITLPDSVTIIGESAFYGCYALTSVTIPDSVTSLGNGAFYNCSNLIDITIKNPACEMGDDFTIVSTAAIHGYDGSTAEAYAKEYNRTFVSIGSGSETLPGDVSGDGKISVSDAVVMQKWLLGVGGITDIKAGDVNKDGKLNVFDLCIIKQKLTEI